jgi:hypothetical protein
VSRPTGIPKFLVSPASFAFGCAVAVGLILDTAVNKMGCGEGGLGPSLTRPVFVLLLRLNLTLVTQPEAREPILLL